MNLIDTYTTFPSPQSDWPRKQMKTKFDKVGRIINWCNHYENQCGVFSKS